MTYFGTGIGPSYARMREVGTFGITWTSRISAGEGPQKSVVFEDCGWGFEQVEP